MPVRAMPDSTHACVEGEHPISLPLPPSRTGEPLEAAYISARLAKLPCFMRVTHLVEETGLSTATITRLLDSGEIKSVRLTPGTRAVPLDCFIEWVASRLADAVEAAQEEA